jgi:hypothetical protein
MANALFFTRHDFSVNRYYIIVYNQQVLHPRYLSRFPAKTC